MRLETVFLNITAHELETAAISMDFVSQTVNNLVAEKERAAFTEKVYVTINSVGERRLVLNDETKVFLNETSIANIETLSLDSIL